MRKTNDQGFVQLIIIVILSIVILSLLGVSISSFINNTTLRENFSLFWRGIVWVWQNYIAIYLSPIWNIIRGIFS